MEQAFTCMPLPIRLLLLSHTFLSICQVQGRKVLGRDRGKAWQNVSKHGSEPDTSKRASKRFVLLYRKRQSGHYDLTGIWIRRGVWVIGCGGNGRRND